MYNCLSEKLRKKELQIINKTIDNKMNKTGKTKSLADYPVWIYQSLSLKIISKVKPSSLQVLTNRNRHGKNILQILFYLAQWTHWMTYLKICTWKMESASKNVFCSKQTRIEVIHEHSHGRCVDSCSEEWLNCALEVLQEKDIYLPYFSTAVVILSWNSSTGLQLYQ